MASVINAARDGEDRLPVIEKLQIDLAPGPQMHPVQDRKIACQPDRKGGKDDVERHSKSELESRQLDGIKAEHGLAFLLIYFL